MNGAEFIRRVRKLARKKGIDVSIDDTRGKGSHVTLYLGGKFTVVQDRKKELRRGTFHAMCKQLGIDPNAL